MSCLPVDSSFDIATQNISMQLQHVTGIKRTSMRACMDEHIFPRLLSIFESDRKQKRLEIGEKPEGTTTWLMMVSTLKYRLQMDDSATWKNLFSR